MSCLRQGGTNTLPSKVQFVSQHYSKSQQKKITNQFVANGDALDLPCMALKESLSVQRPIATLGYQEALYIRKYLCIWCNKTPHHMCITTVLAWILRLLMIGFACVWNIACEAFKAPSRKCHFTNIL